MSAPRRLLTLGHSYVVGTNRALARAMAAEGAGEWEVVCAAPLRFPGDLGPVSLRPEPDEMVVPLRLHGAGSVHTMAYGRDLRALLSRGWDVVHCWEEPYVLAAAQVAAWTPRSAKLVFATFQNLPKRYPPPFRWIERYAMRRAAGWVAFGHTVEAALAGRPAYAARPHRIIPPGVDTARFRRNPAAGERVRRALDWSEPGPPVVGYLGRFVEEKGIDTLLAALDAVRGHWRALFVGGGPLEGRLRDWAAGKEGRARVVTGVAHAEVPDHLAAMDLLCAPSRTTSRWKEQLGRMLLEAFACGVPVLGSDSGEIPHVLGAAGVVLPESDPAAWASMIDGLLADPERRAELAARGRARAEAEFALPAVARRHLDFFAGLVEG